MKPLPHAVPASECHSLHAVQILQRQCKSLAGVFLALAMLALPWSLLRGLERSFDIALLPLAYPPAALATLIVFYLLAELLRDPMMQEFSVHCAAVLFALTPVGVVLYCQWSLPPHFYPLLVVAWLWICLRGLNGLHRRLVARARRAAAKSE